MTLSQAVKNCLRNYLTFSGRATRAEYWYFWLFSLLVPIALIILNSLIFGPTVVVEDQVVFAQDGTQSLERTITHQYDSGWAGNIFGLLIILPGLAVGWRRLHDIGRSGWWLVVPFLVTGAFVFLSILSTIGWSALVDAFTQVGNVKVETGGGGLLVAVVVFGMFFTLLIWLCTKSQPGTNKYGPNPHEVAQ